MKISQIFKLLKKQRYFTKQNLSLALDKEGEDLNYWIKKLTKEKLLIPIKKGFYFSSYYKDESIDIYGVYLANVLRFPSYVSLEYVLAKYNLIPESVFTITSVTLKSSRTYESEVGTFIYQNIKKELFNGYQRISLGKSGLTVKIAYSYKALFDFLYLKKFSSAKQMRNYLKGGGRINWQALENQDKKNLIKALKNSSSKKMVTILKILQKEQIL